MSKIKLTYKEKDYIAEFSRNTAKAIEERGFSVDLIATQPNKMIPLLIYGAFMKNHSTVKQTKIDEIFLAQNHRRHIRNEWTVRRRKFSVSCTENSVVSCNV